MEPEPSVFRYGMKLYMWLAERRFIVPVDGIWPTPRFATLQHATSHSQRCTEEPCKALGVCHALLEIVQFAEDSRRGLAKLPHALSDIGRTLRGLSDRHSATIRDAAGEMAISVASAPKQLRLDQDLIDAQMTHPLKVLTLLCCHRSHRDPVPPGSPGPGSELMVG